VVLALRFFDLKNQGFPDLFYCWQSDKVIAMNGWDAGCVALSEIVLEKGYGYEDV